MTKVVAVFGAGIAGLTVAHECAALGYQVKIYESSSEPGGFFRSTRRPEDHGMPSEYSWHGMGPWYHNTFDVMRQIPFDDEGSVFDRGLSRPIDFGLAPDQASANFYSGILRLPKMFQMRGLDGPRWAWLLLKTFTAGERSEHRYASLNAAEAWRKWMSPTAWRTWRASFGPWIGSDWTRVSLHQAGQFFRKQLMTQPSHQHPADEEGPAWSHGARDGWLLLRGPSSEVWFDKWIKHLKQLKVEFHFNHPLHQLHYDGSRISCAELENKHKVEADYYVLAANPFATAEILDRTPQLAKQKQLQLFKPLTQEGPHAQVSFRIAFSQRIRWPRPRAALVISDSEFNLTIFAQEQAWSDDQSLGEEVQSLWTGTACVATMPGRVYKLPLLQCTQEQFIEEVMAQLRDCNGLDELIRQANGGVSWKSAPILRVEVWHEWIFSKTGLRTEQPKWVNSTHTQPFLPTQATPVKNLVLAGAHTRTQADVWSIEAAVESGRRAVQIIEPHVKVIPQYKPAFLRWLTSIDDFLFGLGLPHVLDVALGLLSMTLLLGFIWVLIAVLR